MGCSGDPQGRAVYHTEQCGKYIPIPLVVLWYMCNDVSIQWSYAVTLWEVLTKAEVPYTDIGNNRVIPSHIGMGGRLPRPTDCPLYL